MAKITIFGLAGTGTSSTGKELAKRLEYTFLSTGNLMRKKAASLDLTIYEFDELCAGNPKYDEELDYEMKEFGESSNNFVVESRLAWHFIPASFKVKLVCDFDERVRRVSRRDNVSPDEAKAKTIGREDIFLKRNMSKYNIPEFAPDHLFDLILDTTSIPFDEILHTIVSGMKQKNLLP